MTEPTLKLDKSGAFWVDAQLTLPAQVPNTPESKDVLVCTNTDRFSVGMYNYVKNEWILDIGRYPNNYIKAWAYMPKVELSSKTKSEA